MCMHCTGIWDVEVIGAITWFLSMSHLTLTLRLFNWRSWVSWGFSVPTTRTLHPMTSPETWRHFICIYCPALSMELNVLPGLLSVEPFRYSWNYSPIWRLFSICWSNTILLTKRFLCLRHGMGLNDPSLVFIFCCTVQANKISIFQDVIVSPER